MDDWIDAEMAAPWASFPLDAEPRPVVLLEDRVRIEGGFADGASKVAWIEGAIETGVPVPTAVRALLPAPRGQGHAQVRLTITGCAPDSCLFRCDRGPRELAAYRLNLKGLEGSCVVLSPDVELWWPPNDADRRLGGGGAATIGEDGLTIDLSASGGVLTEFHRAEFQEHRTYVVGRAITSERRPPPGTTAVPAMAITRQVRGRLETPLAGRVLLDTAGQPFAVVPVGEDPE